MASRNMAPKNRRWRFAHLRERDGDACWICGEVIDFELPRGHDEAWTFDHVVPRENGGPNAAVNLRLAHQVCNHTRGKFYDKRRDEAA
jgi:5-methylcytosine-specific restriction endonuclease McrA